MSHKVEMRIDMSVSENHSGACFTIAARDMQHAQQISDWFKDRFPDFHGANISAPTDFTFFLPGNPQNER